MKAYIKKNQQVYDALAVEYKKKAKDYLVKDKKLTRPFISYLKKRFKCVRVLELGPGSGLNLTHFSKAGFETLAIDVSREILKVSQQRSPVTKYIHGDFLSFNFKELEFEGIFAKAFIHLFKKNDAIKVMRKVFKLLVPGGVAFIATTSHTRATEGFLEKVDYDNKLKRFRKKWTELELLQALDSVGFKILKKWHCWETKNNKKWMDFIVEKQY